MATEKPADWPNPNAAYETTPNQYWAETVDAWGWQWRQESEDFIKSNKCPRCDHLMSVVVGPSVLDEAIAESGIVVWCNCQAKHDQPLGRVGCGQQARVSEPPEAP